MRHRAIEEDRPAQYAWTTRTGTVHEPDEEGHQRCSTRSTCSSSWWSRCCSAQAGSPALRATLGWASRSSSTASTTPCTTTTSPRPPSRPIPRSAPPPANADFHATGSAQGSVELVAQGAVAPPGNGGLGGEAGFAQDGCVGASFEADGDGVAVVDDRAWGFQEAALQGVGGDGVVAG